MTEPNERESASERDVQIQQAQRRVFERMAADPDKSRSTILTSGHVGAGLACEVRQGRFATTVDLGRAMGGDASAPPPGFFARAAIAACVAISIKMVAARTGLRLEAVDVNVETDFDDAALFGLGSGETAPLETRVDISVEADESEASVREVVAMALETAPWFLALSKPQLVRPRVSIASRPNR